MATKTGIPIHGSWSLLTFYTRNGKCYVRNKSSITRDRVKNAPEFNNTMASAARFAKASVIGAAIYAMLPLTWRQGWMCRAFTGEAAKMLKQGKAVQEVKDYLHKTYVEYWELYEKETGIPIERAKPSYKKRAKDYRSRKKKRTFNPDKRRYANNLADKHWKRKKNKNTAQE